MENAITKEELAAAFKTEKKPKKKLPIILLILGVIILLAGAIFLIIKLTAAPSVQDGEYLTSAKEWVLDASTNCDKNEEATNTDTNCEPGVIWKFTEIGKGTLTTNNHLNDYDFIWALEDGKLKIETAWLYDLQNEYEYHIDQGNKTLTLKDGEKEYRFTAKFESE